MTVGPAAFDADGLQNFDDAEDFFDTSDTMEKSFTGIEKSGAEKGDGGVFRGVDGDFAVEFFATFDAKTLASGVVDRENLTAKGLGEFLDHFERDVLTAFLDAVDGGLGGADFFGKFALSPAFFETHSFNSFTNDFLICFCSFHSISNISRDE